MIVFPNADFSSLFGERRLRTTKIVPSWWDRTTRRRQLNFSTSDRLHHLTTYPPLSTFSTPILPCACLCFYFSSLTLEATRGWRSDCEQLSSLPRLAMVRALRLRSLSQRVECCSAHDTNKRSQRNPKID
jgi:hypothetical protein